jgi:hypothetical protein
MSSQLYAAKKKSKTPGGGSRPSALASTPRQSPYRKSPNRDNVWYKFVNNIRPRTPFKSTEKTDNKDESPKHDKENVPLVRDTNVLPLPRDEYSLHDVMGDTNSNGNDDDDSEYREEGAASSANGSKIMRKGFNYYAAFSIEILDMSCGRI